MAACLRNHSRTGIHQNNRQVGRRAAGNHITCVLFVSRSIRNDKLTTIGREVTVSHVNRDTLFTFGLQTVKQQCIVDMLTRIPHTFAVTFQRIQLILI